MEQPTSPILRAFVVGCFLLVGPALSQPTTTPAEHQGARVTSGVVVSATSRTMVVRTEGDQYVLFVFEADTVRPGNIPEGASVSVTSRTDQEGIQVASSVQVRAVPKTEERTTAAPKPEKQASTKSTDPVPPEVRRLERQIERQVRRFRAGVRTGVGIDPEIITAGVHAKLGPFFHQDVFFRPNAEFGFGEVTTLAALNFEAIYRLPITERQSRWSVYLGAGPGFNFIDRNFEEAQKEGRDINFGDFDFEGSLNLLAGVEFRSGMFLEIKSTAYSRPQTRLLLGYSF